MTELIAQGRRGEITLSTIKGVKIATKRARNKHTKWAIIKEQEILRYLNEQKISFVPQLKEIGDWQFSYDWIEGIHFRDAYKQSQWVHKTALVRWLIQRAYELDEIGVIHGELGKPHTNVLVNKSHDQPIYIIDFERGSLRDFSWKNLIALAQRLRTEGYLTMQETKTLWSSKLPLVEIYNQLMGKVTGKEIGKDRPWMYILLGGVALLALDLITKYFFYNLKRGEESRLLTPVLNTGIGRSIAVPLPIVGILTLLVITALGYAWYRKYIATLPALFFMVWALGNGIDRLIYNGVRDFIDLHMWPIFNSADIYLTIAILLLLYSAFSSSHGSTR